MTVKCSPPLLRARQIFSRWTLSAALLASAGAAFATPASTIHVPADYTTIQSAIDAASSGDTIDIADGTYTGPGDVDLDTNGKNLTIQSDNGAASTIIDCGGTASSDGSGNHRGFYIHNGETITLSGLTVQNGVETYVNSLPDSDYGGGICVSNGGIVLENCAVLSSAADIGGGLSVTDSSGSSATVSGCTFSGNTAQSGGGIYIDLYSTSSATALTHCLVQGNTAQYSGGGIYLENDGTGSTSLTNCAITGNTAQTGGGVYHEDFSFGGSGSTTTLTSCTFTGNTAAYTQNGGGFYDDYFMYSSGSNAALSDCIFYGDTGGELSDGGANTSLACTYCDIQGGFSGTGNIDADPLFVSASDFHLQSTSPAIGVGTSSGAPATDIEGTTRPNPPSMGAYEAGVAPVTLTSITVAPAASSVMVGAADQFTATATYSDSTTADVTSAATWASDDTSKATIDSTGLATGITAGTTNVTATLSGTASAPVALSVTAAPPAASPDSYVVQGSTPLIVTAPGLLGNDTSPVGAPLSAILVSGPGHGTLTLNADGSFVFTPTAGFSGPDTFTYQASDGSTSSSTVTVTLSVTPVPITPPAASDYILWNNADGRACVWNMSDPSPAATCHIYGPFPGWTAKTIAEGADGHARILWNNTDGRICLWNLSDRNPVATCHIYGPFPGWSVKALAVGSDNKPRILWSNTDGQMCLWRVNDNGGYTHAEYGPYLPWTARALAVGSDNHAHILWDNTDGSNSLWDVDSTGAFIFHYAGPFAGWSASALSVGTDNAVHLLWHNASGINSVWNVSMGVNSFGNNSARSFSMEANSFGFSFNYYGPFAGWNPTSLADGQNGQTRVLWNNVNGQVCLWSLNSSTAAYTYSLYGPYTGWTATAVAAH